MDEVVLLQNMNLLSFLGQKKLKKSMYAGHGYRYVCFLFKMEGKKIILGLSG